MTETGPRPSKNILINALEPEDYLKLAQHLASVALEEGEVLAEPGEPITALCFPEGAVVSASNPMPDGSWVEVGAIGICGVVGWPVLLGIAESPNRVIVQVGGGTALRIDKGAFEAFLDESPATRALLLRFVHVLNVQLSTTIVSNLRDPIEKRLARWLLMCHDRLDGDVIVLTHGFISQMLGVRRASVTDTLHILEGHGAVRSVRNRITVRDRACLELLAGDSYGFAEALYRKEIAPFGKSVAPAPAEHWQEPDRHA